MSRLELTLLGMPEITIDGQPIQGLASRKAVALLIYLAFTGKQHARQTLAGLLWGDMTEESARRNLRVALTKLRPVLNPYLLIQRRTLSINPISDIWLDTQEFETCLQPTEPSLQQFHRAAKLYQGHFLDEFNLRDAPMFEDWIRPLQERYRKLAMEALYKLAVFHTQQKQYSTGIDYAGRLLVLEPWMEEAHRQLMILQALSGQRSAALAQYETCRNILADELGVEPAEVTQALYEQILNEEIGEDLAETAVIITPTPFKPPFQTPAELPHFVGRTKQQQQIVTTLSTTIQSQQTVDNVSENTQTGHIQALVGMGGVGKSALAIQIAHAVRHQFPGGVLWANVSASEPMAILESWAQMYGYDFTRIADVESMAASFRGVIEDKTVLIILDDVTGVSRVRPLLPSGNNNHVLITTRDLDLARALNAQVWPLVELSLANGRLLLANILGKARVAAEPDEADTICSLLQNLPLAVEITAQRLKSRPRRLLADMALRLRGEKQRLTWLKISDKEVRASFAVSWETLDNAHQHVFALLGLFKGRSFTVDAIAHIAQLDQYLAEDRLFALTALSLVSEEGMNRYRQHSLLADFAREQLVAERDEETRLANYFLHFAQSHQHDYDILRPEWDNMMIAMETAYDHQLWQTVIDFTHTLHDAWFARGRFSQARKGYLWGQVAASRLSNKLSEAVCLLHGARAAIEQSDYDEAQQWLARSLEIYEASSNKRGMSDVQYSLAIIAMNQSQFNKAEQYLKISRTIREQLHDTDGVATIMEWQARLLHRQWKFEEARQLALDSLSTHQMEKNTLGMIQCLRLLVDIELELHKHHQFQLEFTLDYCDRALNLCAEIRDQAETAVTYYSKSRVEAALGNLAAAQEFANDSLILLEHMGDRRSQAMVQSHIAIIEYKRQNYKAAIAAGERSLKVLLEIEARSEIAITHFNIGVWYEELQKHNLARKSWQKSLQIAEEIDHKELIKYIEKKLR